MKAKYLIATASVVLALAGVSVAQEEFDPAPINEGRQSALRDIGTAFKGINDELRKGQPSLALIRHNAKQIDDLVQQQKFWFPPGTGPETEIEMKAKAAIWKQPAEFKAGQTALAEQAQKLVEVDGGQDLAQVRTQWQTLGKVCKNCHDKFREEED